MAVSVKKNMAISSAVAILLLSGCGNHDTGTSSIEPDSSARAVLNVNTSTIETPISEYRLSYAEMAQIAKAREVILGECMNSHGLSGSADDSVAQSEDRPYGLWNVERAKKYGYGLIGEDSATDAPAQSNEWVEGRNACLKSESARLEELNGESSQNADSVQNSAHELVESDPLYDDVREEFITCIAGHGLDLDGGDHSSWVSTQMVELYQSEGNDEALIRVAVDEAQCNMKVGVTQKLSDLEAGYQVPLIKKSEAALKAEHDKNEKALEAARRILDAGS